MTCNIKSAMNSIYKQALLLPAFDISSRRLHTRTRFPHEVHTDLMSHLSVCMALFKGLGWIVKKLV